MKLDLKALSRKELEKLRADVDKALVKLDARDKKTALAAAEKVAKAHGYALAELTGAKAKPASGEGKPAMKRSQKTSKPRAKVPPKYRNPDNSAQTWTGRGRKPKWVEAHLAKGGALEEVLI